MCVIMYENCAIVCDKSGGKKYQSIFVVVLSYQVYFYCTVRRQQKFCEIVSVFILIIPFIFVPLLSFMVLVSSDEILSSEIMSCGLVEMCATF